MMIKRLYTRLERIIPQSLKELIPQEWRIKLGYQIKVKWHRATRMDFLDHSLTLPSGETEESIFDYLSTHYLEGSGPTKEFEIYLQEACKRFLYTLQMIPSGTGQLLEIGSSPYFASLLLRRFTKYQLTYTNYFGPTFSAQDEQAIITAQGERIAFPFHNINVETEPLPFAEDHFDIVLLCEVLEHFTNDPLYALLNIKRVLKPGGYLILSTPNVARLANVARILAGQNIYDPYSGYGPYGRHNREYNLDDLNKLLTHAGFTIEQQYTSDVHPNRSHHAFDLAEFIHLVKFRQNDLGQYIFIRAKNDSLATPKKPNWLYRNYPPGELVDSVS